MFLIQDNFFNLIIGVILRKCFSVLYWPFFISKYIPNFITLNISLSFLQCNKNISAHTIYMLFGIPTFYSRIDNKTDSIKLIF